MQSKTHKYVDTHLVNPATNSISENNDQEEQQPITPTSLNSAAYSLESTASAHSTANVAQPIDEVDAKSICSALRDNIEQEQKSSTSESIVLATLPSTSSPDNDATSAHSIKAATPGEELEIEDLANVSDEQILNAPQGPQAQQASPENTNKLQRSGSIESKAESIKTELEANAGTPAAVTPTAELSRAQSEKSLLIEEEIEDNKSFIMLTEVEEQSNQTPNKSTTSAGSRNSIHSSRSQSSHKSQNNQNSAHTPKHALDTEQQLSACSSRKKSVESQSSLRSLTQCKAVQSSLTKSVDSLYERPTSKPDSLDNTTETSSSGQLPAIANAPQTPTLKQKSKSLHLLGGANKRRVAPSNRSTLPLHEVEVFPTTLSRMERPREALLRSFDQLDSSSWENTIVGLKTMVRLMRHHCDTLDAHMHMSCIQLTKAVRNLRSQVSRAACQAANELFGMKSKFLEQECDDLVCALLHRTADTNRFLRADAMRALESFCDSLTPHKVLHILTQKGALHPNALVRTTTAKLLNRLVERLGCDRIFAMQREHRDKFFVTGANMLMEGSLDTRSYAKTLFRQLSEHQHYSKVLLEAIPQRIYRNVEKSLRNIR